MTTGPVTIEISLPHPSLSPNSRVHWSMKARWKKSHRNEAFVEARQAQGGNKRMWKRARVEVAAYFPTVRRRDGDNFAASLKAALDGMADAGVVVNDEGFVVMPPVFYQDTDGRVILHVTRMEDDDGR